MRQIRRAYPTGDTGDIGSVFPGIQPRPFDIPSQLTHFTVICIPT
jgi:hypothetical protein